MSFCELFFPQMWQESRRKAVRREGSSGKSFVDIQQERGWLQRHYYFCHFNRVPGPALTESDSERYLPQLPVICMYERVGSGRFSLKATFRAGLKLHDGFRSIQKETLETYITSGTQTCFQAFSHLGSPCTHQVCYDT